MNDVAASVDVFIPIDKASEELNIPLTILKRQINDGNIKSTDGMLSKAVYDEIKAQQELYIGIGEFLKKHDSPRFDSKYAKYRDKYIDFLEENSYFGIEIVKSENILFNLPGHEDFYITKEDAQLLEYKSEEFFKDFGYTDEELVNREIESAKGHPVSTRYLKPFLAYLQDQKNIYVPSLVLFVRTIYILPDINRLTDEDVVSALEDIEVQRTKLLLISFFKYVSQYENVKYHNLEFKRKERNSKPAYPYTDFVRLARILFNKEYDESHALTQKALNKSIFAETWMFLACHYICGWRASDICDRWIYPDLKSNDNPFKIRIDTLKEDLLNDVIPKETYDKITLYCLKRIEMANNAPQKTGVGKLRSEIVPELRYFFGRLILIAEYRHFTFGDGYMNSRRIAAYKKWVNCKAFFGNEIIEITGKQPISSRRLNKSYLQGLEQSAISDGNTTLVAHVIAAYARNHANINTTVIYLKDHGLTGESADVVLYMMMQRGVFGVSVYNALIAAYPESFEKLTMQEQTEVIKQIDLSAYELETLGTPFLASLQMADAFAEGETREPIEILKAMFAVTQDRGHAKDQGIYCVKKALGYACVNPDYETCIGNLCPYHIFTSEGVPALIKVIKNYQRKWYETGNRKYEIALKTKIIPAFQNIINAVIQQMSEAEKSGIKKLIKECLNG